MLLFITRLGYLALVLVVNWTGQEDTDRRCKEEEVEMVDTAEVSWDNKKLSSRSVQSRVRADAEAT